MNDKTNKIGRVPASRGSSILDRFLLPFRRTSFSPESTLGAAGTPIYSGYVVENERNPKLSGFQKYVTYSDMLANISIVAAGTRYFLNLVSRAGWRVTPADQSDEALRIAESIEEYMHSMKTPWHRVIRRAAMYRFYGFSVQEWTAERKLDGSIGFYDIAPRAQFTIERWDVDLQGYVRGVVQRAPQDQQELYIPRAKLLYVVDDTLNDSPEGLGLFRHIAMSTDRLSLYEKLEGYGFEQDLRGIPIARGPFAALKQANENGLLSDQDLNEATSALTNFIKNHNRNPELGLALDSITYQSSDEAGTPSQVKQWDLELLTSQSNGQADVARAIERVNREIARVIGVEQLLLGDGRAGSFALSQDKSHNFGLIVDSTLNELTEQIKKDFVAPLINLNGWNPDLIPEITTEAVQFRDVEQITNALKDVAQAGAPMMPNDEAVNDVRDILGISKVDLEAAEDLMEIDQMLRQATGGAIGNAVGVTLGVPRPGARDVPQDGGA